jgi:hypothetical protein
VTSGEIEGGLLTVGVEQRIPFEHSTKGLETPAAGDVRGRLPSRSTAELARAPPVLPRIRNG